MGESFDHCPAGWIRQSRKCCTQSIHNHMVVDYPAMSSVNFAIPDFCSLVPGWLAATIATSAKLESHSSTRWVMGSRRVGSKGRMGLLIEECFPHREHGFPTGGGCQKMRSGLMGDGNLECRDSCVPCAASFEMLQSASFLEARFPLPTVDQCRFAPS
jgi:hypothetical protein